MKVTLNAITQPNLSVHTGPQNTTPMLPEEYMIYCARVSSPENRFNNKTAPKLLKYLIDNKHWSPFEMISIGFEIETSRAMGREILRHKSAAFQEFSQRYAKVIEFEPVELRYKADKNRQSSSNICEDKRLIAEGDRVLKTIKNYYHKLLDKGIAKECARFFLPETTKTTIVLHGTLRTWIHFLEQRCSDNAQKEIRLIALEIRDQLCDLVPWTATALGWVLLSDKEIQAGELVHFQRCPYRSEEIEGNCDHIRTLDENERCNFEGCPQKRKINWTGRS